MINADTETTDDSRQPYDPQNTKKRYQFTTDEIRVLKECNKESFYYRCLPYSAILASSTYYGIKTGFFKGNPRFGATPKVLVAIAVGYFAGKFSYQSKCAEKLMQLPHSQIGEMLRQKRRGNLTESVDTGFGPGLSLAPFTGINPADTYSDVNPYSSLDLDTSRPETPGLDDHNRPSLDNPAIETYEEMPPEQKGTTTYEELRKRNRDEYTHKRTSSFKEISGKPSTETTYTRDYSTNSSSEKNMTQNKYGDKWE